MKQNNEKNNDFWIKSMRFGIFMGCHQRPDRSFFFHNKQFPLCARCVGVVIGEIAAIILFLLKLRLNTIICLTFCGIMFCDWFVQKINILESTNTRRLITGLLGGYGYLTIVCKLALSLILLLFNS